MPIKFALNLGWLAVVGMLCLPALAKNDKPTLPPYMLTAHTVAILVDPNAGISLSDPNANQVAQKDVEAAILTWGRFTTVMGAEQADLVIVVHKGHGKLVDETVQDPRQNSRPGSITATPGGIGIGAQHGRQPSLSGGRPDDGTQRGTAGSNPQMEVGAVNDSFEVYEGQTQHPMDGPPGWRWTRKNALHAHDVPAVAAFRKAIDEADKQLAASRHP